METQNQGCETRRVYQAPVMALVQLRPEEAVLVACKVGSGSGPNDPGTCTSPTACMATTS